MLFYVRSCLTRLAGGYLCSTNFTSQYQNDLTALTPFTFSGSSGGSALYPLDLGFTFDFFDVSYTDLRACFHGWITFPSDNDDSNFIREPREIPFPLSPNPLIAAFWDWWLTVSDSRSGTLGTAPNRKFVYHQRGTSRWQSGSDESIFQIHLYETTNVIEIYLAQVAPIPPEISVTVGIENQQGDIGNQVFSSSEKEFTT